MKQLFRLLLLLSFIPFHKYALYASSYGMGIHIPFLPASGRSCNTIAALQDSYYFNSARRPAAQNGRRNCRIAVKEEDEDDNKAFSSKKEQNRPVLSRRQYRRAPEYHADISSCDFTRLAKDRHSFGRHCLPYTSCRTHVILEVFRI